MRASAGVAPSGTRSAVPRARPLLRTQPRTRSRSWLPGTISDLASGAERLADCAEDRRGDLQRLLRPSLGELDRVAEQHEAVDALRVRSAGAEAAQAG